MDQVKRRLHHLKLLAYLDDLILLSETFEAHVRELQELFKTLQEFGLRINRPKCQFCCPEVKYLGHIITAGGLRTNPGKVEAISKIPEPRNIKQLMSLLQTCSWYRRFVPNFAEVTRPLTQLTKKTVAWTWGEDQQKAMEEIKRLLTTATILKQADETKPFTIKTDASAYAIGAVLVQGERDEDTPWSTRADY